MPRLRTKATRLATLLGAGVAATLAACTSLPAGDGTQALARQLSGHFSSAAQARADKDYFAIELRVVPVWPERADGPWLYVEQADASTPDKPYRQRLYRLERQGDQLLSHIYSLKGDPLRHAGAWRSAQPLAGLGPADLELRAGCSVVLTRGADGSHRGATAERSCPSDLRGARWATSQVQLDEQWLESWDRGYNEAGEQVWGARKGPYRFQRLAAPLR